MRKCTSSQVTSNRGGPNYAIYSAKTVCMATHTAFVEVLTTNNQVDALSLSAASTTGAGAGAGAGGGARKLAVAVSALEGNVWDGGVVVTEVAAPGAEAPASTGVPGPPKSTLLSIDCGVTSVRWLRDARVVIGCDRGDVQVRQRQGGRDEVNPLGVVLGGCGQPWSPWMLGSSLTSPFSPYRTQPRLFTYPST